MNMSFGDFMDNSSWEYTSDKASVTSTIQYTKYVREYWCYVWSYLEKILEWEGSLDEFSIELSTHFPRFSDNNRNSKKELLQSVKTRFGSKKHRYVMKLLDQPLRGDISGIQDVQSYSPEYNIQLLEKIFEWDGSLD